MEVVMSRGYPLSEVVKDGIWELRAEGLSDREIGRRLGLGLGIVSNHLRWVGGIRPKARRRPERCLSLQARGTLKRELTRHLRRGRTRRYARAQSSKRQGQGKLTGMVMISERPPEVEDRAVPGHWEGDLLMGGRTSAIATLVERQTRYLQLIALPDGPGAIQVCEA